MDTHEITAIDMDQAVIANSLAYDEEYGLYVGAIFHHRWEHCEEHSAYSYVNYGGGVYKLVDDHLELIMENHPGVFAIAFSKGIMYVSCVAGDL